MKAPQTLQIYFLQTSMFSNEFLWNSLPEPLQAICCRDLIVCLCSFLLVLFVAIQMRMRIFIFQLTVP